MFILYKIFKALFLPSAQPVASKCRDLHTLGFEFAAGDQVSVHTVVFVDPCNLVEFAEVVDTDELLFIIFADNSKDRIIPGIDRAERYLTVEYAVLHTKVFQFIENREEFVLDSSRTMTVFCEIPVEVSSVEVTGISCLVRIIFVGIVVELSDFITTVDDRNTGL